MSHDSGDILGLADASTQSRNASRDEARDTGKMDAFIDSEQCVREGIFRGIDVEPLSADQLSRVLELDCMVIDLNVITRLLHACGTPRVPNTGIIPKLVSEACKRFISDVILYSRTEKVDFIAASAAMSKKYRL